MTSIIDDAATFAWFGYWPSGLARTSHRRVIVTCEGCGKQRDVVFNQALRPCYPCAIHNPQNKRRKRVEESGNTYGRLTIVRYVGRTRGRQQLYLCTCICGNTIRAQIGAIKSGNTLSCGCIRVEKLRAVQESHSLPFGVAASRGLFRSCRRSAHGRGIDWLLTMDEFLRITKENCHYCGRPPKQKYLSVSKKGNYVYNGIDRLDSDVPYKASNVVPACKHCNYAKRMMSVDEFYVFIERVFNHSIAPRRRVAA